MVPRHNVSNSNERARFVGGNAKAGAVTRRTPLARLVTICK
jgi:hypothetical protein